MVRRLLGLSKKRKTKRPPIEYEEAKRVARADDTDARRDLASREDIQPEILYYLVDDESADVRREIAANTATPRQADITLTSDVDDDVRCDLALKIARIAPKMKRDEQTKLRELTLQALDVLAQDQLPRVRQILAEELKEATNVPVEIIERLAKDIELIVAAPVLEYSPLLSDDFLIELINSRPVQGALPVISRRAQVAAPLGDAIVAANDVPAVAALLANPNAQIREETLDDIIERAEGVEPWHEPIVNRPTLSQRAIRRVAGFVASSLLNILQERSDLDQQTARELKKAVERRLEKESKVDVDALSASRAERMFNDGKLDDEVIVREIEHKNLEFVTQALALMAKLKEPLVRRIIDSRNGKSVTSLAWSAGLKMKTATALQRKVAKVPRHSLVSPQGADYPLSEDEMAWQIEFFET